MRRHAFEPARLLLGLAVLGIALAHVMTATGRWDVPLPVLLSLLPAALLLAGTTAAVTHLVRGRNRGRDRGRGGGGRRGGSAGPLPDDRP